MALHIGDADAASGMSKAIYDQLNALLSPPLQDTPPADLEKIRDSWRKLAYAISRGVIEHIVANMEIRGIETRGNVDHVSVSGNTGAAPPADHVHSVNLSGTQSSVVFTQSNDGTGHVG